MRGLYPAHDVWLLLMAAYCPPSAVLRDQALEKLVVSSSLAALLTETPQGRSWLSHRTGRHSPVAELLPHRGALYLGSKPNQPTEIV